MSDSIAAADIARDEVVGVVETAIREAAFRDRSLEVADLVGAAAAALQRHLSLTTEVDSETKPRDRLAREPDRSVRLRLRFPPEAADAFEEAAQFAGRPVLSWIHGSLQAAAGYSPASTTAPQPAS